MRIWTVLGASLAIGLSAPAFAQTYAGDVSSSQAVSLPWASFGFVTAPTPAQTLTSLNGPTIDSAAGTYNVTATDTHVCVSKTTAAANTVQLPSSPATGRTIEVKDCAGNSASNNITILPAAGLIDGASSVVISTNYKAVRLEYTGTGWGVW